MRSGVRKNRSGHFLDANPWAAAPSQSQLREAVLGDFEQLSFFSCPTSGDGFVTLK